MRLWTVSIPNQTKPNQTKPNQTKPNQTKPNQTKPNQPSRHMTGGEVDIVRADEIKGMERHIFLVSKRSLNDWARLGSSNHH